MIRADTTPWFANEITASRFPGYGILGSDVPILGTEGSSLLAQAVQDNSWEADELRLEPEYGPVVGAVALYEDTSAVRVGAPLGNSTTTYRIYRNNAYEGLLTVVWENGDLPFTQAGGTIRADVAPWFADAITASQYVGYGVLGSDIPVGALLYASVGTNGWEDDELRLTTLTEPSSGSIQLSENTEAVFSSQPPGVTVTTYNIYRNEALEGVLTVTWESEDSEDPQLLGVVAISALTPTSYTASWAMATDNVGVAAYEYRLNGGPWTSNGLSTSVNIAGRTPLTADVVEVRARDAALNYSGVISGMASLPAAPASVIPKKQLDFTIYVRLMAINSALPLTAANVAIVIDDFLVGGIGYKLSTPTTVGVGAEAFQVMTSVIDNASSSAASLIDAQAALKTLITTLKSIS